MFVQVSAAAVPRALQGVALVDSNHMPRYWAAVWLVIAGAQWATSTQTMRLRYIENLYEHADRSFKANALDDALSDLDDARLADILESWFVSLRNQPVATRGSCPFRAKSGGFVGLSLADQQFGDLLISELPSFSHRI